MSTRGRWWKFFIILLNDFQTTRKVGMVIVAQLENWNPEINSYIGETTLDDKAAVERDAMNLAIEWLVSKGYQKVHTTVPDTSTGWLKMIEELGFYKAGKARRNETTWEKYIADESTCTEYVNGREGL